MCLSQCQSMKYEEDGSMLMSEVLRYAGEATPQVQYGVNDDAQCLEQIRAWSRGSEGGVEIETSNVDKCSSDVRMVTSLYISSGVHAALHVGVDCTSSIKHDASRYYDRLTVPKHMHLRAT